MLERKRIDDLAASIKDNRYKDQKKRLKETATYTPFFLIEYKKHTGFMPWATVTQSIANIAFYNHFKLIFTESMAETCAMLREMAKHIKNFKEPQTHDISIDALQDAADRRKPQNKNGQMINLFLCFHGMTPSKAVKLAEDVGHVKNLKYGIEGIISNKNYLTNAMKKQLILFFKPY
jgi:ERCC4-type nuclease